MKKALLLCAMLLLVVMAKAQNIVLQNTSCQPIGYAIYADAGCGTSSQSTIYNLPPGAGLKLSMYPGGPYPMVNWTGPIPVPGAQFNAVKVFDPAFAWGNGVGQPCVGLPFAFGPQPGCGAQCNSSGWGSAFTFINAF